MTFAGQQLGTSRSPSWDAPTPSPSSSSSAPALEEEDSPMSDDDSAFATPPPPPPAVKQEEKEVSVNDIKSKPKPKNPPPLAGPMFLNFKRDLSLKVAKSSKDKGKSKSSLTYKVNGVNILNKASVDGKTVLERQKQRRVRHNHIERLRRDTINNIIHELSSIIPDAAGQSEKPNKGNVLRLTLDHVKRLQQENRVLYHRLEARDYDAVRPRSPLPPIQHHPAPMLLEIPPQHGLNGSYKPSRIPSAFSTYSGNNASSSMPSPPGFSPERCYNRRSSRPPSPIPSHQILPPLPSINLPSPPPRDSHWIHPKSPIASYHRGSPSNGPPDAYSWIMTPPMPIK